jgi:serine protease Do
LLSCERISQVAYGAQLKTDYTEQEGSVIVESVGTDGPAAKGGLQAGDVILIVDKRSVRRRLDVELALIAHKAGDEIAVEIRREGNTQTLGLVLAKADGSQRTVADLGWSNLGMRLTPMAAATFRKYQSRYRGGLKVDEVRDASPAQRHGIRRGDVLVGMHKWETISEDNVSYILNSAEFKATQPFKFYILRNGETLYGNMRLDSDE